MVLFFIILSFSCFAGIRKELNYFSDSIAFYSFENGPELPSWLDRSATYLQNEEKNNFRSLIASALYQMGNKNDSLINDSAFRIFSKELSKEIAERSYEKFEHSPYHTYQLWILKKRTRSIRGGEFEGRCFCFIRKSIRFISSFLN
ncbi:hypothetical protein LEP1GSC133_1446 [Leptospira borgpetersenii serovar Pomona str. 200901868]|uniref:Uncharacterized protein n=1 Tax=Leptospira borgpetersenii serovar Pomona str. 200901868 TaxID=1192866 RepID=M6VWG2_LEPBO|nr:hypothetical protein LEP1GSC133_1446 [Leptospira borgpetersenii serovar Pomona str. 200901868]